MSIPREKRGARRLQGKKHARFGVIHANAQKAYRYDSFGEMKGRTYVVNSAAVHHQQRAYKARHRLLAEPAGGASPKLPSIANKVQAIEPNTSGNPNTPVPDIMDIAGSSKQTPPQASATDSAPKKSDCIYQDATGDFGSDDLPDDDKSTSPSLPSEQKTKSTNQAQN